MALLLRHSLQSPEAADAVEGAVSAVLASGLRTADLAATSDSEAVSTTEFGDAVLTHLSP
jgi:3-isopropylmalate dehydrogenase